MWWSFDRETRSPIMSFLGERNRSTTRNAGETGPQQRGGGGAGGEGLLSWKSTASGVVKLEGGGNNIILSKHCVRSVYRSYVRWFMSDKPLRRKRTNRPPAIHVYIHQKGGRGGRYGTRLGKLVSLFLTQNQRTQPKSDGEILTSPIAADRRRDY